jgi:hypothetical protein
MSTASTLLTSAFLALLLEPGFAADNPHTAYLASVATFKSMAGFNQVVGPTRFAGYFLQAPGLCRVTVFTVGADDERLVSSPGRIKIDIPAADRIELAAGDGSALAIACNADADAIAIAPQHPANVVTAH